MILIKKYYIYEHNAYINYNFINMKKSFIIGLSIILALGLYSCEEDEKEESILVEVETVQVTPKTLSLIAGRTKELTVKVLPDDAEDKTITWTSSDLKTAIVSEKGLITAIKEGKADIIATSQNQKIGICKLTVRAIQTATFINVDNMNNNVYLMATEDTFCEVNGEQVAVKEGYWVIGGDRYTEMDCSKIGVPAKGTLKILDVSKITVINMYNMVSMCDFSDWDALMYINVSKSKTPVMDFGQSTNLDYISIKLIPELTSMDISSNAKLQSILVVATSVETLSLKSCPIIKSCIYSGDGIKSIDLSQNTKCATAKIGGTSASNCVATEINLCTNLDIFEKYNFKLGGKGEYYPEDFVIKCYINADPNSVLPDNQAQLINAIVARGKYLSDRYIMEFTAGEPRWKYDIKTNRWIQK